VTADVLNGQILPALSQWWGAILIAAAIAIGVVLHLVRRGTKS
jgi:hypothetical protein